MDDPLYGVSSMHYRECEGAGKAGIYALYLSSVIFVAVLPFASRVSAQVSLSQVDDVVSMFGDLNLQVRCPSRVQYYQ